jgi:hypothetical protein
VGGQLNDAVLFEDCVFSEHSIDAAAQRAGMRVSGRGAADPTLEKTSCHAITDSDAGYPGADFGYLPSAIRERHEVRLRGHPIRAQSDCQVAKIERAGRNLDQHLSRAWLWDGKIDLNESVNSGALQQLMGTHVTPRSPRFIRLKASVCSRRRGEQALDANLRELTIIALLSLFSLGLAWAYEANLFAMFFAAAAAIAGIEAVRRSL